MFHVIPYRAHMWRSFGACICTYIHTYVYRMVDVECEFASGITNCGRHLFMVYEYARDGYWEGKCKSWLNFMYITCSICRLYIDISFLTLYRNVCLSLVCRLSLFCRVCIICQPTCIKAIIAIALSVYRLRPIDANDKVHWGRR